MSNGIHIQKNTAVLLSWLFQFGSYLAITWFYGWGLASLILLFLWGNTLMTRVEIMDAIIRLQHNLLKAAGIVNQESETEENNE